MSLIRSGVMKADRERHAHATVSAGHPTRVSVMVHETIIHTMHVCHGFVYTRTRIVWYKLTAKGTCGRVTRQVKSSWISLNVHVYDFVTENYSYPKDASN